MNALEITGLEKTYPNGVKAVAGLDLSVPEGAVFGFLGLNGAGKTSTIRMIAGLTTPDKGSIRIFGEEPPRGGHEWKRPLGFVLDEPLYFDWMSPCEYLPFVGKMYGLPPATVVDRTSELIEFFDLVEFADEQIGSFSTGMKKKVSLAAAIIHTPRFLILDEPLDGIDALAASEIKETLRLMASTGTTIFITSHVLDTVEKLCSDIAIIHHGTTMLACRTVDIRDRVTTAGNRNADSSLEQLFVEMVADRTRKKHLSWIG